MVSFLSLNFRLCVRLTSDFSTCFFFVLADFFPGHSQAVPLAIEAAREARRANGEEIAADTPRTIAVLASSATTPSTSSLSYGPPGRAATPPPSPFPSPAAEDLHRQFTTISALRAGSPALC